MSTSSSGSVLQPSLLPFSLHSYDGSAADDEFPVSNLLSSNPSLFHCSREGHNFNLVLRYTPTLTSPSTHATITHLVIHGPTECTAPIRTGIVFASMDPPDVASYSPRYDNLTRAEYEALPPSTLRADGAVAFFTCTDLDHLQTPLTLPAWVKARYLHFKLLSCLGQVDDNIDIARIAVVGYSAEETPTVEVPLGPGVLAHLGLVREPLTQWNRLSPDHIRVVQENPICVLWGRDPFSVELTRARSLLHAIATSGAYDDRLTFFHCDDSHGQKGFTRMVAMSFGVRLSDEGGAEEVWPAGGGGWGVSDSTQEDLVQGLVPCTSFLITAGKREGHRVFHYDGTLDDVSLRRWLDALLADSLVLFLRSESLPATDPSHPGLTIVTGRTFHDLVINNTKDVFVFPFTSSDLRSNPSTWLTLPILYGVAEALQDWGRVVFAIFNTARNDSPPKLGLQSDGAVMWVFPGPQKEMPMPFPPQTSPSNFLSLLHQMPIGEPKFNLPAVLARIEPLELRMKKLHQTLELVRRASAVVEGVQGALEAEEKEEERQASLALMEAVKKGEANGLEGNTAIVHRFIDQWTPAFEAVDEAKEALAAAARKMVGESALTSSEREAANSAMRAVIARLDEPRGWRSPAGVSALRSSTHSLSSLLSTLSVRLDGRVQEMEAAANGRVVKVHSPAEFHAKVTAASAGGRLLVIDFTAVWCGPCKTVTPILGELSLEWEGVDFIKVDVEELGDVAEQFEVSSMPTFVFMRGGAELERTRIQGANVPALKRTIQLHAGAASHATAA